MERNSGQQATEAYERLAASSVRFAAGDFQLGARLQDLPRSLRVRDVRDSLGLAALLAPTPPRWVHLDAFSLASRPVTNGEYLLFVEDPAYEDPLRWQRVFDDLPPEPMEHVAPDAVVAAPGLVIRESLGLTRSFLAAHVRSLLGDAARELEPERFADSVRSSALELRHSDELAWVAALCARALGPSLPADHRRDLGPFERDKLALLEQESAATSPADPTLGPSWPAAFEALDVVIGGLRDTFLRALREEGPARTDPRAERGLVERDYQAADFPIAALKLLDRLRTAFARASDARRGRRIPLRQVMYPRSWTDMDPRLGRESPDRSPWHERPVTGVSLYEALAYADWLTRASGGRAHVRLPTEAELERAATWPIDASGEPAPSWKRLFPEEPAGRIELLLGSHWEWTRDRLKEADQEAHVRSPWFVARGGPARGGGTPLSTRRFGFAPLLGQADLGFRVALEPLAPGVRA